MSNKVYVTYESNGQGGQRIEKIFTDKSKAINWVIETRFAAQMYYNPNSREMLELQAAQHIHEHVLED